ncbi:ABC transporter permease subunit [Thiorhodospira sibirica]|uniref:ABC transporter permease subunit n=1 Tax=Thiorhodospira sibirica TaxID=154347 RepID=UPI00022C119D|nr:ABC transporter permease subunit [Thiorhodospira sibirica]
MNSRVDSITRPDPHPPSPSLLPTGAKRERLRKWRYFKDRFSRYGVAASGLGVVFALALIFIYLFSEVMPVLKPVTITPLHSYALSPEHGQGTVHLTVERYQEVGAQWSDTGEVRFFNTHDGSLRKALSLPLAPDDQITAFGRGDSRDGLVAYGLADGRVMLARVKYQLTYPDDQRYIDPQLEYPLGEAPLVLDPQGMALQNITIQQSGQSFAVAAHTEDGRIVLARFAATVSFMTGEVQINRLSYELPPLAVHSQAMLMDKSLRTLLIADQQGLVHYYDVSVPAQASLVQSQRVVPEDVAITAFEYLAGTVSVIIGASDGSLRQWFLVRDEQNVHHFTHIRQFQSHPAAIVHIAPEYTRKGFYVVDAAGHLGVHYATSHRSLAIESMGHGPLQFVAVSPINQALLVQDADGQLHFNTLFNAHPQVSFKALWHRVWYEGRAQEEYVWQSSSASDDFESKFSLIPLTIGTLKAALFAMLFAMPLAIMGAIYTAYFMTPRLRGLVKPSIEIMEALPTVILGFLAGLWLAPFVENNLPAVFSILMLMPLFMLLFGFFWLRLPNQVRLRIPPGWEAALLVPVVLIVGWLSVVMSPLLEIWLFDGSMRQWLTDIGINYDQRNALVVGIAMGFAVIPTIFSIAEDAVFNVPKHLTQGSLALGATAWQTVVGVVLPTASPGIFAAVMMGFGRAVGETMIVLMATGNSPVVNFNIFEGMRTLSANIAVELPETAVGSSHYRILFLAALVLFVLTFIVNTLAEVIRQRLRKRYSNL